MIRRAPSSFVRDASSLNSSGAKNAGTPVAGSFHRSCRPDRAALWRQLLFQRYHRRGTQWLSRRSHRVQRTRRAIASHSRRLRWLPARSARRDTVATEPEVPNDVLVGCVVSHDDRRTRAHHLLRTLADIALKTTATQNAGSLSALSDQHPCARTSV